MSNIDSSFTSNNNYENNHVMISQGGNKKAMKKILSVALSTAMAFSMFASVAFGQSGLTDVNAQYNYLKDKGIFTGYTDGQAHLDRNMTRAEFATVIARTLGLEQVTGVVSFKDKNYSTKHWAAPYVEAVAKEGIMEGQNTTKKIFGLTSNVTVQEMATVLVRALKLEIPADSEINNTASAWAKGYVQAAINAGLVDANADFQSNATRALLVGAAYAMDQQVSVGVKSYNVTEAGKVVEFTMSDDQVVRVTLDQALEANKETAVKFTYNGKEFTHKVTYVVNALAVESVTAVNAKTVVVKFNNAIDASTIIDNKSTTVTTDDTVKSGAVTFTAIDGQTTTNAITSDDVLASLSEDGKTLTLTAPSGKAFTKRYTLDIAETVKDTTGQELGKYSQIIDTTDETRPTVVGTSYEDNGLTLKVSFSEPLNSTGTIKLLNGTTELSVTPSFTAGDDYILIPLGGATIPVNQELKLQIVGATDFNGNALTPNPYETTVIKTTSDTTKPVVSSVEVVNDKQVKVTFSEKLIADPTITVGGDTTTLKADSTGLVYTATLTSAKTGLQTVKVTAYSDLASNAGEEYSKVVEMKADTTAPKLVSYEVKKVDGVEKLILTFDENVTPKNSVQVLGSSDRYVNTDGISVAFGTTFTTNTSTNFALYNAVDGESKSVALDITDLPKGTYKVALAAVVSDLASTPNDYSEAKEITFVRTTNAATTKPALDASVDSNGVTVIDNNTIEFTFTQPVSNTALDLANYNIDGISLASAEFYGNNKTVRVTLANNANTVTGVRTITVKNIANTSGIVMDNAITSEKLKENVAPTFTASLVAENVIKVDFSEAIANSTLATALGASNFTVKVDGTISTVEGVYSDSAVSSAVAGDNGYKTVYLKLNSAVTDLSKTITVAASGIVDVNATGSVTSDNVVGNAVSKDVVTVSK